MSALSHKISFVDIESKNCPTVDRSSTKGKWMVLLQFIKRIVTTHDFFCGLHLKRPICFDVCKKFYGYYTYDCIC